jgi:hypothetical protein
VMYRASSAVDISLPSLKCGMADANATSLRNDPMRSDGTLSC